LFAIMQPVLGHLVLHY